MASQAGAAYKWRAREGAVERGAQHITRGVSRGSSLARRSCKLSAHCVLNWRAALFDRLAAAVEGSTRLAGCSINEEGCCQLTETWRRVECVQRPSFVPSHSLTVRRSYAPFPIERPSPISTGASSGRSHLSRTAGNRDKRNRNRNPYLHEETGGEESGVKSLRGWQEGRENRARSSRQPTAHRRVMKRDQVTGAFDAGASYNCFLCSMCARGVSASSCIMLYSDLKVSPPIHKARSKKSVHEIGVTAHQLRY